MVRLTADLGTIFFVKVPAFVKKHITAEGTLYRLTLKTAFLEDQGTMFFRLPRYGVGCPKRRGMRSWHCRG
jgi:hypothetical protein